MVDERSDSRAPDAAHAAGVQFEVVRARPPDAATLARFLGTSRQVTSRLAAPTLADLERLLEKTEAGILFAVALMGGAEPPPARTKFEGAVGYSLDAGTLRLFSLTLLMEAEERAAAEAGHRLLRAAEDLAREFGATVMAAQVDTQGDLIAIFLDAGFSIDDEEPETSAGGGVIPVASVIKLVEPASL